MKFVRDNGLTIVLVAATIGTLVGMTVSGLSVYNEELAEHRLPATTFASYIASGHFLSALFENWESEFLQMSAYVVLTAFLFQRGSAESKAPDQIEEHDLEPADQIGRPGTPKSVWAGGLGRTLYAHSLGIALLTLFLLSFTLHLLESARAATLDAQRHGMPIPSIWEHAASAQFWFESFQNWQSEFLSTAVLVVLSIFLRFRGSPESKPVVAPHTQTGA